MPEPTNAEYVWDDDLIWCPSQCECDVTMPDGSPAFLYLRWRWSDPWTAYVVTGVTRRDDLTSGDWHDLDIGYWRDDQLAEAKAALIIVWESWRTAQSGREKNDV
jgi:hypothetical protein